MSDSPLKEPKFNKTWTFFFAKFCAQRQYKWFRPEHDINRVPICLHSTAIVQLTTKYKQDIILYYGLLRNITMLYVYMSMYFLDIHVTSTLKIEIDEQTKE